MSAPDLDFLRKLHYLDEGKDATVYNIGQTLESCLSSYCKTLNCSDAGMESGSTLYAISSDPRYDGWSTGHGQSLVASICDSVPRRVNSDVGGIGVGPLFSGRCVLC